MNFSQMLVIWNIKGAVRKAQQSIKRPGCKKIRVRVDPNHIMFIRYDKDGPMGVALYFDSMTEFYQEQQIGDWHNPETTREEVLDFLNILAKETL